MRIFEPQSTAQRILNLLKRGGLSRSLSISAIGLESWGYTRQSPRFRSSRHRAECAGKSLEEIGSLALACGVGYFECETNEQLKIPVQRKAGNEKSF